ncbi:AraC family transcriptional regulator [Erwinia sp. MMLR14_017]|uniref:AraC family transcriptional regulator n=1 Tax=Erwinia sp. MMLR14_017 TaxID=3093842 RepID=UPI002990443C|nr:AraC family transcriptional regulator [Erwinia sp. MMLR14_017]MDW8845048.1 AraC family transcriptional regulator [Erwinia sp. MMLR14_017]
MLSTVQHYPAEPFTDLIRLLKPLTALFGGLEATGKWALSFRKRDDVLFCWIERGECHMYRQGSKPLRMGAGDFVLLRTDVPFVIASDPAAESTDSETAATNAKGQRLRLGSGHENPVVLHAGKFVFDTTNQDLLIGLLPSLLLVERDHAFEANIHTLMAMSWAEANAQRPGREFVMARLVELLLVDILRAATLPGVHRSGLLAGLADKVTARALTAMHANVSCSWTIAMLAQHCAVSRSTLAARFCSLTGIGPMAYLHHLRMALAKEALLSSTLSIGQIALAVGFKSQSAFSSAFMRKVGCPPTQFAASVGRTSIKPARRKVSGRSHKQATLSG